MTARVATPAEAEQVRSGSRSGPDPLDALLSGEVVHFDDLRVHFNAKRLREDRGLRLRSRVDGSGGRYFWTEEEPT